MVWLLKPRHLLLVVSLGGVLALLGMAVQFEATAPPASEIRRAGPLEIAGLAYSNYAGEHLVSRLEARELVVQPRKVSAFKIKSLNEMVLRQATFMLNLDGSSSDKTNGEGAALGGQLTSGLTNLADAKGLGRVTRGLVEGVCLDLRKSGRTHLEVTARGGELDIKKKELRMEETVLHGAQGKKLTSRLVIWDEAAKLFRVPGAYLLSVNGKDFPGEGALVDMDFNILPVQSKSAH